MYMVVQKVKDKLRSDSLKCLQGDEGWSVVKFANPWAGMSVEALTDTHMNHTNTNTEKEKMIR
jgi:hypothetical protein